MARLGAKALAARVAELEKVATSQQDEITYLETTCQELGTAHDRMCIELAEEYRLHAEASAIFAEVEALVADLSRESVRAWSWRKPFGFRNAVFVTNTTRDSIKSLAKKIEILNVDIALTDERLDEARRDA